ncbi:MAG: hypothetical protein KDD44_15120, partial [Bdellovibrionales bacterium]|nr:hypothetical protein [Bdellovibrionales bacterium]
PEYRKVLCSLFEVYDQIEEAFLVGTRNSDTEELKPVLGVVCPQLPAEKRASVADEAENLSAGFIPRHIPLQVVMDLGDDTSLMRPLFRDAKPFYIKQQVFPQKPAAAEVDDDDDGA